MTGTGAMIRDEMDRHGIDRSAIRVVEGRASGFSVVNVAEDADRAIYMARALTAETKATHVETHFADYIRSAAMVTTEISQLPLDAVIAVLRIAREDGVPTVLDVDVPPDFAIEVAGLGSAEDFEEALRLADVVKPAKAAALQMVEADTSEERAEGIYNRYGARLVAITEGAQGSVVTVGKQTVRVPAKPVEARDTTGAGDAFLGGLIAGLFHGLSLRDTASLANACGAVCCRIPRGFSAAGIEPGRRDGPVRRRSDPCPERSRNRGRLGNGNGESRGTRFHRDSVGRGDPRHSDPRRGVLRHSDPRRGRTEGRTADCRSAFHVA